MSDQEGVPGVYLVCLDYLLYRSSAFDVLAVAFEDESDQVHRE